VRDMPAWNGIYGVLDRTTFETQFHPITVAEYRRAALWAMRHDTYNPYHDVLMEEAGEGNVCVLPTDCMPYPWRTLWRKRTMEDTPHA
jgi:hypothetical protein